MPLSSNDLKKVVLVDEEDRHLLLSHCLCVEGGGYVNCIKKINGVWRGVRLHHLILGKEENKVVDHINGDKLDNRKCNLRHVSRSINQVNRPKRKDSRQKLKGIQKLPSGSYRAKGSGGKHIGTFKTAEEAHQAWKKYTGNKYGFKINDSDNVYRKVIYSTI